MLIDQLPQIVREAAHGLANANINVLNGADGLGEIAAGLVGQGLTIFDSVKRNFAGGDEELGQLPERQNGDEPLPPPPPASPSPTSTVSIPAHQSGKRAGSYSSFHTSSGEAQEVVTSLKDGIRKTLLR